MNASHTMAMALKHKITAARVRFTLISLVLAVAPGCLVMEPDGATNGDSTTTSTATSPCEMVLSASSFAGYCGNFTVTNNGTYPTMGWQVAFDLPSGSSLLSSWNGNFQTNGTHVVVTSLEPNNAMAVGSSLELGYCASASALDVSVQPGSCVVQNANGVNVTTPATSLNSAMSTTFTSLDTNAFQVALASDGYQSSCPSVDANATSTGSAGLSLGACGGVQWQSPVLYGVTNAHVQAAAANGVVTQLFTGVTLPSGIQGMAMAVSGSDPNTLVLTVWKDGVASTQTVALGFDATQSSHDFTMSWQQNGITWTVDNVSVGTSATLPEAVPEYLDLSVWIAAGAPSWAGTADANAVIAPATVTSLVFAPTVAIE